jgi:Uma2 family endonuclease
MSAAKSLPLLSVREYLDAEARSDIRHEYCGGYVYAMAGGRNAHNALATTLLGVLYAGLRGQPCQPFNSDTKLRIRQASHTRFYYPDAMVVCEPNPSDDVFQDRPRLVAEVVSESTRRIDEGEKREAYLTIPTLSHYLLIETDRPQVTVHDRHDDGFRMSLFQGLDARVALGGLDLTIPLGELYVRIDLPTDG